MDFGEEVVVSILGTERYRIHFGGPEAYIIGGKGTSSMKRIENKKYKCLESLPGPLKETCANKKP